MWWVIGGIMALWAFLNYRSHVRHEMQTIENLEDLRHAAPQDIFKKNQENP